MVDIIYNFCHPIFLSMTHFTHHIISLSFCLIFFCVDFTPFDSKVTEAKIVALDSSLEVVQNNEPITTKRDSGDHVNLILTICLLVLGGLLFRFIRLYRKAIDQTAMVLEADQEKALQLKEIHHRIKNNLQVVSSLLTLQSKFVQDNNALEAIKIGKARVQSMSILHKNLYQNSTLKDINVKKYFDELTENLMNTYKMVYCNVEIRLDVEELYLDVDTVVPLGLITNELVCNALKHAFPTYEGSIEVKVKKVRQEIALTVKDDGKGIPFKELKGRSETLGMQLVQSFAKKLKADISIDNVSGTTFCIKFNVDSSSFMPSTSIHPDPESRVKLQVA